MSLLLALMISIAFSLYIRQDLSVNQLRIALRLYILKMRQDYSVSRASLGTIENDSRQLPFIRPLLLQRTSMAP